jgi:hypothetical protein
VEGLKGEWIEEPLEVVYIPEKRTSEINKGQKDNFIKKFECFNRLIEYDLIALDLINSEVMTRAVALEILECLEKIIVNFKDLSDTHDIDKR